MNKRGAVVSTILELYNKIYSQLEDINDQIADAECIIEDINNAGYTDIPARIEHLEKTLEKVDEYVLKVRGFQELAKKNLDSQNVLTIQAPPGYRVNLNRLKNWAMLIDPQSDNDPYAQRVLAVAKCDECFLEQKREEFTLRIEELKNDLETGNTLELERINNELAYLKTELKEYVFSEEVLSFANRVKEQNDSYIIGECPEIFETENVEENILPVGMIGVPLKVDPDCRSHLNDILGKYYDEKESCLYIPLEKVLCNKEFGMTVSCIPSHQKISEMDAGIRSLLFNIINKSKAGTRRIYVIDAERQNSSIIGSLKVLEGTFALAGVPRNKEQITSTLEEIVSSFADIDEQLENFDTVLEYNDQVEEYHRIERKVVVFIGWPKAFNGKNAEFANRIITNYERYGVSFIVVSIKNEIKKNENFGLSEYMNENVIHINTSKTDTIIRYGYETARTFEWYKFKDDIKDSYADSLKSKTFESRKLGNEYTKRFDLKSGPDYKRGNKSLELPFGIDSKDNVHSISFDNENFATYLMGASGSGKSTLIHTLITGILKNYHPDDVELWLADFKMSEFAQYINPLPPHVKYILLDESHELVYDLLDKLTDKMMERQRFFMRHKEMKKVENVPNDIYMPIIFVLFDEFSIMSQAVAESDVYKLKLQNLLAKGRALGIKFLFSSQTFTDGIRGLTETAKKQIQSRIAMKNSREEISETLQLSANLKTEQVRNWLDAIPPHYALYKYRNGDALEVKRLHVMYFEGDESDNYVVQKQLINDIRNNLRPVNKDEYDSSITDTYVDKCPVIVDGNSYKSFESQKSALENWQLESPDSDLFNGEEIFLNIGTPRTMDTMLPIALYQESRENVLLVGGASETNCCAAIVNSIIKSFMIQDGHVEIWGHERNSMFRRYNDVWNNYKTCSAIEEICERIYNLKESIFNNDEDKKIIVLMGFERIYADFELYDSSYNKASSSGDIPGLVDGDDEEVSLFEFLNNELGPDELSNRIDADKNNISIEPDIITGDLDLTHGNGVYDAKEDFNYILKRGSRLGYHFIWVADAVSDLRQNRIDLEYFRHKIAFNLSRDDSWEIFGSKIASDLGTHICQYSDGIKKNSFHPYIHKELSWDGWYVDEDGIAKNEF